MGDTNNNTRIEYNIGNGNNIGNENIQVNTRTLTRRNNRRVPNMPNSNSNNNSVLYNAYNANNNNSLPPLPPNAPLLVSPGERQQYRRKLRNESLRRKGKITGYFQRGPKTISSKKINKIWGQLGEPKADDANNNIRLIAWYKRGLKEPKKKVKRKSRTNRLIRRAAAAADAAEAVALSGLQDEAEARAERRAAEGY